MFTPLDIIIIAFVIVGLYIGSKRGVIKSAARIVAIVVAIIGGFRLRWIAERFLLDSLNLQMSGEMVVFVSFCIAFVVVYILTNAILGYLTEGMNKLKIGIGINNAIGALLGGVVSTLILSLAFVLLSYVNFPSQQDRDSSLLYPHVRSFARYTLGTGVGALREATQQLNKIGVTTNPKGSNAPAVNDEPMEKPGAIR
jgi:uncharacterized membrane protein required for colicin V production